MLKEVNAKAQRCQDAKNTMHQPTERVDDHVSCHIDSAFAIRLFPKDFFLLLYSCGHVAKSFRLPGLKFYMIDIRFCSA